MEQPTTGRLRVPPAGALGRWTVGLSAAYLVATFLVGRDTPARDLLDQWGFLPVTVAASLAFGRASKAAIDRAGRHGMGGAAWSFGLTALGTAASGVMAALGRDPTYSWPNLLFLASYPPAIAGVVALRVARPSRNDRWRLAIDTAIAVVAAVAVSWLYIAGPLAAEAHTPLEVAVLFAFPIGDLILFAALVPVLLAPREPQSARLLRLLAAGQMIYLAGDLGYQLPSTTVAGLPFDWTDLVYLTGYVGMAWTAEAFARAPVRVTAPHGAATIPTPGRNLVPMVLGLIVYLLLLAAAFRANEAGWGLLALTAVGVTALIVLRERLTERENVSLARDLESERGAARLRSAIRNLPVGVIVLDRDGRIREANAAAGIMLGADETTLTQHLPVGADWDARAEDGSEFQPERDPAKVAAATGQPVRDVVLSVAKPGAGGRTWLMVDANPALDADGRVDEVVVTLRDITERRLLEEQLRQSQRMEAIGQLAGGVAHDFNNLLTAIIGHAAMLQSALDPADPRSEDAAEIRASADRATRLTRQLLAFSRRQLLNPEVLDLNEVVRGAGRLLQRLLGEHITIAMELSEDPVRARVDRGQIEQVIINLAVNARDAMPKGGRLFLRTRALAAGRAAQLGWPAAQAGAVLLQVTDTGHGMDQVTAARAFEPFFTTKEVGQGTGLGLATVYGIVQQSGGDIRIESQVGRGTTVSVYLPRTEQQPAQTSSAATDPTPPAPPRRETILVVEDDPSLRTVIRQVLAQQGYRVVEAADANQARALLERSPAVDLLLTDVVMPGQSGPELAAWARRRWPRIKVVLITGYADAATLRVGLDLEQSRLLQKPFDPPHLLSVLRSVLDGPTGAPA